MSTLYVFCLFICLYVKIKKIENLLTLSPHINMQRSQKRPRCGHAAALWDSHTDRCRSCCGCSRELPCGTSKAWSPERWEKAALSRSHSSRVARRGKSLGPGRAKAAAATSQGAPTTVGGIPDITVVAGQGTLENEVTLTTVSAEGPSQAPAITLSHTQTECAETIAATGQPVHRSTGQPGNRSTGHPVHGATDRTPDRASSARAESSSVSGSGSESGVSSRHSASRTHSHSSASRSSRRRSTSRHSGSRSRHGKRPRHRSSSRHHRRERSD